MQKDIQARRDAVDQFIAGSSTSPGLLALQDLSAGLPKTIKIDVTQFNYVVQANQIGGKLSIKGETDGYSSAEAIKDAIKKIPNFSDFEDKQSGGKPGTDNKIIEFTFNMSYKRPSASPGKG